MKQFLTFMLFFYCMVSPAQELPLEEIRSLYSRAAVEKSACEKLMDQLDSVSVRTNPLLFGYRGSATMMMAEHVGNPFSKLCYFNKGKEMLNGAIEADKDNMELRFLRFAAQTKAPAMLGYRGQIEEDKKRILEALPRTDDASLKKLIVKFMAASDFVGEQEKKELN